MTKKLTPVILLASTYLIGQAYVVFDSKEVQNWIWMRPTPMPVEWNVKFLSEEINRIIEAVAFYMMLYKAPAIYRLTALEYLIYRIIDIFAYFYNYKTESYWFVMVLVGSFAALIFLTGKNEKTNYFR